MWHIAERKNVKKHIPDQIPLLEKAMALQYLLSDISDGHLLPLLSLLLFNRYPERSRTPPRPYEGSFLIVRDAFINARDGQTI